MIKGFKYVRPFMPERWIDGDTVVGLIDHGDGSYYRPKRGIRIVKWDGSKYDAPEKTTLAGRALARLAWNRAMELVPHGVPLVSTCHRLDPDDFGRPLCSLLLSDERDLATVLTVEGFVK